MVQKSSAIALAILGLSAATLATPIPPPPPQRNSGPSPRTNSGPVRVRTAKNPPSVLPSPKTNSGPVGVRIAKNLPSVIHTTNLALSIYKQYLDNKRILALQQQQQQQRPGIMNSTRREFDDTDILERDYESEDIQARSHTGKSFRILSPLLRKLKDRSYDLEELD